MSIRSYVRAFPVPSFLILFNGVVFLITMLVLYSLAVRPPGEEFISAQVAPATVCQGDRIHYTADLAVNRKGVVIYTWSIWSVADNTTVAFDEAPRYAVYTEPTRITRDFWLPPEMVEMAHLTPGAYQLRVAFKELDGPATTVSLPFWVLDCAQGWPPINERARSMLEGYMPSD